VKQRGGAPAPRGGRIVADFGVDADAPGSPNRADKMRRRRPLGLVPQLSRWFGHSRDELPGDLQKLVAASYSPFRWDGLTRAQRERVAGQLDAQRRPSDPAESVAADLAFRSGFKKVSVPLRNKKNAKHRRPTRQRVTDTKILQLHKRVATKPPHKRCSAAFQLLSEGGEAPLSARAFRDRWNALGLKNKKKGS